MPNNVLTHGFAKPGFSTDLTIHWGNSPLRPELAESTYLLFKATGDPFYLDVGAKIVESLNTHARVKCGFASIKDVRSWEKEDQMVCSVVYQVLGAQLAGSRGANILFSA